MEQDEIQRIVVDPEDPIDLEDPGATAPGLETTQKKKVEMYNTLKSGNIS
jgi:hypothetical protein